MKFQDIFNQAGLYKSESFAKGCAFKIHKNTITGEFELYQVQYNTASSITPIIEIPVLVYGNLFNKTYTKVLNRNQLFE